MIRSMRLLAFVAPAMLAMAVGGEPSSGGTGDDDPGLAVLLGDRGDQGFARAIGQRRFDFPADHGPHPEFRNEWWYFTGNLANDAGRPFGFELTFFRIGLKSDSRAENFKSRWRSEQLLLAHFAITDIEGKNFHVAQRYSRVALGLAGYREAPLSLWLEDWRLEHEPESDIFVLSATEGDMALRLSLEPQKPPVLNGDRGLSRKSDAAGNASYYYSLPRLAARGSLEIEGQPFTVSGYAWMDREWSTSALGDGQVGWDWFALQFADGSELMYYQLRRDDGGVDRHSAGTFVARNGEASHLEFSEVALEVLDEWRSPRGGVYPAAWSLRIDSLGLEIEIHPRLADQELDTFPRYWEGAVEMRGERQGVPVSGLGYVELTGYADRPLPQ